MQHPLSHKWAGKFVQLRHNIVKIEKVISMMEWTGKDKIRIIGCGFRKDQIHHYEFSHQNINGNFILNKYEIKNEKKLEFLNFCYENNINYNALSPILRLPRRSNNRIKNKIKSLNEKNRRL